MERKIINTEKAPSAIGPYSQAVVSGGLVYCSGQIPIDPATSKLVEGGVEDQAHQVMKNLSEVLKEAGSSFEKAVKMTIYLKDLNDFAKVNEIYGSYLSKPYPARVTVEVSKLPLDVLVEIDAIAEV